MIPIEVVFAKQTLGAGDAGYGALLASWGAGMVVGGLAFAVLRRAPLAVTAACSAPWRSAARIWQPPQRRPCSSPVVASGVGGTGNGIQWVG